MLNYKDIIIKHYALSLSGSEIARQLGASKSGVNDFLRAFDKCESLSYPLPPGITNYGIAELVYGSVPGSGGRNESIEYPDYEADAKLMATRKNMTLVFLWNRYSKKCAEEGKRFYQYRQYCELYNKWCDENYETAHFDAVIAQKMEVDFAGQTFDMTDPLTGETLPIVVFVAILPYSQYIYAEGMLPTKEPQWIEVNNHALDYFGGVPALVVCDNCKQAVIANQDWIEPELNKDYADWADHYGTAILPAKVRKPKFKSSVENAVAELIGPQFQEKVSTTLKNRLTAAHLKGSPEELVDCVDSDKREYLPSGITEMLSSLDFIERGYNLCILGESDAGKSYLAKAIGIKACNRYNVGYFHSEELLESMVALKEQDYDKYARKMKKYLRWELIILDDFLLHTITDEREIKILFELLEKRNEQRKSTIVCSQRDPVSWKAMILNDEVSANSIMKRATKHYTIKINTR